MKIKVVFSLIIIVMAFTSGASAWDNEVHKQMVKDAVVLCPYELREFLKEYLDSTIKGAIEPDILISTPGGYAYGYSKHYYIPDGDRGLAPEEVEKLSISIIELINDGFIERGHIAYRMGLVSHYVADAIEPKEYIGIAPNYPNDFLVKKLNLSVTYNGYIPIGDFSSDLKNYVAGIWYQDLTVEEYYDHAVNYIVDVWTSIWEKGGMPLGELVAVGSAIRPKPPEKEEIVKPVFSPTSVFDINTLTDVYTDKDLEGEESEGTEDEGIGEGGTTEGAGEGEDTTGSETPPTGTEPSP